MKFRCVVVVEGGFHEAETNRTLHHASVSASAFAGASGIADHTYVSVSSLFCVRVSVGLRVHFREMSFEAGPAKRHVSFSMGDDEKRKMSMDLKRTQLAQEMQGKKNLKKRASLTHWQVYKAVSWRRDAVKDYHEHTSTVIESTSFCTKLWAEAITWIIPGMIGFLTAAVGSIIEVVVEVLADLRFGFCKTSPYFKSMERCDDFHFWNAASKGDVPIIEWDWQAWLFYVVISVTFGLLASSVVWIEPTSRGSGIPEVKTILGGFVMPNVLSAKTLFMKFIGLMFSVSAGLALGKEGPLVHVACCWSNMLANLSSKYKHNESQRRHLISTGAAAGVSTAFGAPIGGVLFSYEEVSSMFPQKTMIRSFFAAVIAAMTLWQLDATGTGKLTMFQVQLNDPAHPIEYVVFVLLGVLGGLLGAFFCWGNIEFNRGAGIRQTPTRDVFFIILFTSISSYPMLWTANLSSPTIRILFQDCGNVEASDLAKMRALCTGTEPSLDGSLCERAKQPLWPCRMSISFVANAPHKRKQKRDSVWRKARNRFALRSFDFVCLSGECVCVCVLS